MNKVWFITGAGRGMGTDIAKAALAAGNAVVATGRSPKKVAAAVGAAFNSAYAAAKFAIEGWMESLTPEVAPFGIRTMIVEPGFFRTELLEDTSTTWPKPFIDDYAERTRQTVVAWQGMSGRQGGDPAKLAKALVQLAAQDKPPLRWVAGADAVEAVAQKARALLT